MNAVLEAPEVLQTPMSPRRINRISRPAQRIVLTGFMGSGKSTVGPLLAAELGWSFVDLDEVIVERTGLTVPQIFAERGETAFRHEETAALASVLGRPHTVIALGGGAPETLGNRLLLEQTPATAVVYLEAPFAILADRCVRQAADPTATARPNFADPTLAAQRFATRHPLYLRLAQHRIDTSELAPADAVSLLRATLLVEARRT